MKTAWKPCQNGMYWQVWRQIEELWPGEPMNSRVRECKGCFDCREEAQQYAEELNKEG